MGKIIGIDLGTTNSVVAVMENGEPKILSNDDGNRTTPSVVAFTKDGERLVGQIAKRQAVTNPENTIYSSKRFMGRLFSEVSAETKNIPYTVQERNKECAFNISGEAYTPEQIAAFILQKLKKTAEDYLGQEVTEAVITVPAYFNDRQKQATKDAGKIAGLDVKRILNEPTAAALAYGLDKKTEQKIVIYDFGGGTFDVSVLEVGESVVEVISTNGDTHLGGDNFDQLILEWLITEFKKEQSIDLSSDKMALQRLREAAEKAKIELSTRVETDINLPFITADQTGPKHLQVKLTRSKFEQMSEELVARALKPCQEALKDAGLTVAEIDEVGLVGGSTRIPSIQESVKKFFGKEPNRSVNPDEVVAIGAAVQGGVLAGEVKDVVLLDVTPLSFGIETMGGVFTTLIERNSTIPCKKTQIFSTAAENQPSVDVHVLQGERKRAEFNKSLGRFELVGIPPAPRGVPQIEVTFDIDANGILNVTAKDLGTGKAQNIKITAKSGLTDEDIEQMVRDAEANAEGDKVRNEQVTLKNNLDTLIYQTEKTLKDHKDEIPDADKKSADDAIVEAKAALESDKNDDMKAAYERLTTVSHTMSSALYNKQQAGGAESADTGGANTSGDDVIDADFKDVND